MPIKPENAKLYGTRKEWRAIVGKIRERSGDRCEWPGCGLKNGTRGFRLADGSFEPIILHEGWNHIPREAIKIILTTAHLDHDPTNNDLENLKHWCQMHHLRYDAKHHAETARATREKAKGPTLFDEVAI